MTTVFRVDSSSQIGTGHVVRCLSLAEALQEQGQSIRFVCRDLPGNLAPLIRARGFEVALLPALPGSTSGADSRSWLGTSPGQDAAETIAAIAAPGEGARADLLVIDHYGIDREWESRLRPHASRILVIDDLADREHDCDLLLDQNFHLDPETRYRGRVPAGCRLLLGPGYALLRREFGETRARLDREGAGAEARRDRILVLFGGADITNETLKTLKALRGLETLLRDRGLGVDVVIGSANPHRASVENEVRGFLSATLHVQSDRIHELMASALVSIGAGGTSTWERCCLGVPSIVIAIAENQVPGSRALGNRGFVVYLGTRESVSADSIGSAATALLSDLDARASIREKGLALVDGHGAGKAARILRS